MFENLTITINLIFYIVLLGAIVWSGLLIMIVLKVSSVEHELAKLRQALTPPSLRDGGEEEIPHRKKR